MKIKRLALFILGTLSLGAVGSCGHSPAPSKTTWTPALANAHITPFPAAGPAPSGKQGQRKPLSVTAAPLPARAAKTANGKRAKTVQKKTTLLAILSNDYRKGTRDLMVVTDAKHQIVSIQIRNNRKKRTKTYPASKLNEKIPLAKTAGVTLVELQCLNFDPQKGCLVQIEYPYNITYASFRRFRAELKLKNGQWGFYQGERRFVGIHMIAKKWLGILVGIKEIQLR